MDALKDDPIWQIDIQVRNSIDPYSFIHWPYWYLSIQAHLLSFFKECAARNTNNFSGMVDQLSTEEITVVRQIVSAAQAAPPAPAPAA